MVCWAMLRRPTPDKGERFLADGAAQVAEMLREVADFRFAGQSQKPAEHNDP